METKLDEFSFAKLPEDHLERLRLMIIKGDPEPQSFYPFQLVQLITKGFDHNHAGVKMDTSVMKLDGVQGSTVSLPIYRLYFDGLIIRVLLDLPPTFNIENLKGIVVGTASALVVTTVPFDQSLQHQSIQDVIVTNRSK